MLEYERLIGGIEERIRLMTRGKLYRKMRKGGYAPHTHSSEVFDRYPENFAGIEQPGNFGRASFFPGGDPRDERPTVHEHRSRRTAKVDGYISPMHDTSGFGSKDYQVPQSNTPLTHSRMSVARTPVSRTPNIDADRLGDVVGMVVPSVISYVKHYLRENSLENEQKRMQDRIKQRQNQEMARSLDQSPHRNTSTSNEHKRSGSFGTRNEVKTPCSACSGVKERLSALEQALQLNNVKIENPYQERIGFESQFVATTPKGFSGRLKKPLGTSSRRSKGEGVSTEKKSVVHSLSSRSQSRKSLAQQDRDTSTPMGLKSSMASPTNGGDPMMKTKKKKVSLKLPSPKKLSREGSKKSSRTNKSIKSKDSKSADSQISKPKKELKASKLKSKFFMLGASTESKLTKKSKLSKSIDVSTNSHKVSKPTKKLSKKATSTSKQQRKSQRSLSIATSHKTDQSKSRPPKSQTIVVAAPKRPQAPVGSRPATTTHKSGASRTSPRPNLLVDSRGKKPLLAHSLLLDSRLGVGRLAPAAGASGARVPASVKSAVTPKGIDYSTLAAGGNTSKKRGQQTSGLVADSGIVQRLKTVSSRMGSVVETPLSRSGWKA